MFNKARRTRWPDLAQKWAVPNRCCRRNDAVPRSVVLLLLSCLDDVACLALPRGTWAVWSSTWGNRRATGVQPRAQKKQTRATAIATPYDLSITTTALLVLDSVRLVLSYGVGCWSHALAPCTRYHDCCPLYTYLACIAYQAVKIKRIPQFQGEGRVNSSVQTQLCSSV